MQQKGKIISNLRFDEREQENRLDQEPSIACDFFTQESEKEGEEEEEEKEDTSSSNITMPNSTIVNDEPKHVEGSCSKKKSTRYPPYSSSQSNESLIVEEEVEEQEHTESEGVEDYPELHSQPTLFSQTTLSQDLIYFHSSHPTTTNSNTITTAVITTRNTTTEATTTNSSIDQSESPNLNLEKESKVVIQSDTSKKICSSPCKTSNSLSIQTATSSTNKTKKSNDETPSQQFVHKTIVGTDPPSPPMKRIDSLKPVSSMMTKSNPQTALLKESTFTFSQQSQNINDLSQDSIGLQLHRLGSVNSLSSIARITSKPTTLDRTTIASQFSRMESQTSVTDIQSNPDGSLSTTSSLPKVPETIASPTPNSESSLVPPPPPSSHSIPVHSSQQSILLESEDVQIQELEHSGALTQVIGSQSTLSQEIRHEYCPEDMTVAATTLSFVKQSLSRGNSHPTNSMDREDFTATSKHQNDDTAIVEGTEEQYIQKLDQSGALTEVVGSQSTLSQELKEMSPDSTSTSTSALGASAVISPESVLRNSSNKEEIESALMQSKRKATHRLEDSKRPSSLETNCEMFIEAAQIMESKEQNKRRKISQAILCNESLDDIPSKPTPFQSPKAPPHIHPPTISNASTPSDLPSPPKRTTSRRRAPPSASVLATAQAAAQLSRSILHNEQSKKQLLLRMALVRENPRHARKDPPPGSIIPPGFFWGAYPSLESILKNHMPEYYELSTNQRQSLAQQEFNNTLVQKIRKKATEQQWTFDPMEFHNDRKVRDRIRCFYKTHIQNSKKRLRTMLKNPTKRANAKALVKHMDLMEQQHQDPNVEELHTTANTTRGIHNNDTTKSGSATLEVDSDSEEYAQDPMNVPMDDHDVAQQVLALGFVKLSQDPEVKAKI